MRSLHFNSESELNQFLNRNKKTEIIKKTLPVPGAFEDRYKNKWEREYASYLDQLKHLHQINWWAYEPWTFRLADNTHIKPDFVIAYPDCIEIHDTKGFKRPQWWAKFKILKDICPIFKYATVKKISGEWVVSYV